MKKLLSLILALTMLVGLCSISAAEPTVYSGSARGFGGDVKVEVTVEDGKVTETVLSFPYALQAGKMEIVTVEVQNDGSVAVVGNAEVSVSVTLDWKDGGEHEIEL